MSLLLWLLGGVVLGVGGEQIVHRLRPPDLAPGGPRNRDPGTGRPRPGSRRRVVLISVGVVALVLVVSGIGIWLWASSVFNRIERVAVGPALSDGGRGTNYLLVGTDNRAGVAGNRSDTILLLRIEGGKARMLSIPRDLYVTIANTGKKQRINAAYNSGAINLVRTVTAELGLPVDRYLEVNFVSFGGLVDAVGGVDIDFPNPAFDRSSGLDVKQAGRVRLDGKQALAYVRSRHFVEIVNGQEKSDPGGDLSREQRQQTFLRAVLSKAGGTRNPFRLTKVASAATKGLRIDNKMTLWDGVHLAWNMGGFNPESVKLPVVPTTLSNGAQVLLLKHPEADLVLASFRG